MDRRDVLYMYHIYTYVHRIIAIVSLCAPIHEYAPPIGVCRLLGLLAVTIQCIVAGLATLPAIARVVIVAYICCMYHVQALYATSCHLYMQYAISYHQLGTRRTISCQSCKAN